MITRFLSLVSLIVMCSAPASAFGASVTISPCCGVEIFSAASGSAGSGLFLDERTTINQSPRLFVLPPSQEVNVGNFIASGGSSASSRVTSLATFGEVGNFTFAVSGLLEIANSRRNGRAFASGVGTLIYNFNIASDKGFIFTNFNFFGSDINSDNFTLSRRGEDNPLFSFSRNGPGSDTIQGIINTGEYVIRIDTLAVLMGDGSRVRPPAFFSSLSEFSIVEVSSIIPEPDTWVMMLFGFFAVGFSMRHRINIKSKLLE